MKQIARPSPFLVAISICGGFSFAQTPNSGELQRRLAMHSGLFRMHDYGKPLTSLKPDRRGIVEFTADFLNDYIAFPASSAEEATSQELQVWVKGSEAILLAKAEAQRSAFT